jgi:predicted transcriptional regulator
LPRRTRTEIVGSILKAARPTATRAHIRYQVRLPDYLLEDWLNEMIAKRLLYELEKGEVYSTSEKGEEYLQNLAVLLEQAKIYREKRIILGKMLTTRPPLQE